MNEDIWFWYISSKNRLFYFLDTGATLAGLNGLIIAFRDALSANQITFYASDLLMPWDEKQKPCYATEKGFCTWGNLKELLAKEISQGTAISPICAEQCFCSPVPIPCCRWMLADECFSRIKRCLGEEWPSDERMLLNLTGGMQCIISQSASLIAAFSVHHHTGFLSKL